jgi:hypothetical protein
MPLWPVPTPLWANAIVLVNASAIANPIAVSFMPFPLIVSDQRKRPHAARRSDPDFHDPERASVLAVGAIVIFARVGRPELSVARVAFSIAPAAAVGANPGRSWSAVRRSPSCLHDTNADGLLGRLRSLLAQGDWSESFHGESAGDERECDNAAQCEWRPHCCLRRQAHFKAPPSPGRQSIVRRRPAPARQIDRRLAFRQSEGFFDGLLEIAFHALA